MDEPSRRSGDAHRFMLTSRNVRAVYVSLSLVVLCCGSSLVPVDLSTPAALDLVESRRDGCRRKSAYPRYSRGSLGRSEGGNQVHRDGVEGS